MAKITFSNDQKKIIDSRNENLLVSAAAGSGKTAVLVERIIRRVIGEKNEDGEYTVPGIDIDRLLVVTFTNAAAREMKERIMKALENRLAEDQNDSHLAKQATLIHNAKIMTIDSFCLYLVKNHFNEIGIDPSFRIATEGEIKLLKQDIVEEVIKEAYEDDDEDFHKVIDCYSNREDDGKLSDCILKLFSFAMSYPWPHKWIENHRKDYFYEGAEEFLKSDMMETIWEDITGILEKDICKIAEAKRICQDGPVEYLKAVGSDEEQIVKYKDLADKKDFYGLSEALKTWSGIRIASKAGGSDDDKVRVKKLRDEWKKSIGDICGRYFAVSLETALSDMKSAGTNVNKVLDLLERFMDKFDEAKRERGIIDFVDMEHMAVQILIDEYNDSTNYKITPVAQSYRDFFEEVMVDEYQDANLVQEILLRSVSREDLDSKNNRFMVGDIKQSIYRFRLARPQIFMGKQELYSKSSGRANRLITLKENYRSRKSVIDSVNAVFERIMTTDFGGTGYDDEQKLYAKADYSFEDTKDNKTELLLFEKEDTDLSNEMQAVAAKIHELRGKMMVYDKDAPNGKRPADYKDFAILFRSQGGHIDKLCTSLEEYGIPYHLTGSGAFYSAREVCEVVNFLRVLNNPLDDISLYGMMVSFFGKFSDEDMAGICKDSELTGFYLWDKVREYKDKYNDSRIDEFVNMVENYRKRAVYTAISALISQILEESGYTLYVAALPDGAQRLANVKMLITKASEFSQTSFHGLFHFLRYIELMGKISVDEGEADISDENANTVRLMSIHKSKGLEFPICFVVGLSKQFNAKDQSAVFITDIDRGIGAQFFDTDSRIRRDTLRRSYVLDKMKAESLSEEIRVLYVAMTRAREKLIMTGSEKNVEEHIEKTTGIKTGCFLDMILPIALENPQLIDINILDSTSQEVTDAQNYMDLNERRLEFENRQVGAKEKELMEKLIKRFSFEYPYKNLEKLYTKTTVSELKIAALEEVEGESHNPFPDTTRTAKVPLFAGGEENVSGTDRGTAFHKILSLIEFENFISVDESVAAMLSSSKITEQEKEIVSMGKLASFMNTEVSKRMQAAAKEGHLFKEQPFVIGLSADRVNKEFSPEETVLVQGVIDVYFEESDGLVVLDYKTDRVERDEELVERYKTQLDYYAEALTIITGKSVKEKLIYSFGLNKTIVVK